MCKSNNTKLLIYVLWCVIVIGLMASCLVDKNIIFVSDCTNYMIYIYFSLVLLMFNYIFLYLCLKSPRTPTGCANNFFRYIIDFLHVWILIMLAEGLIECGRFFQCHESQSHNENLFIYTATQLAWQWSYFWKLYNFLCCLTYNI